MNKKILALDHEGFLSLSGCICFPYFYLQNEYE